jgi:lauroyl/myristoyl acyltransferase
MQTQLSYEDMFNYMVVSYGSVFSETLAEEEIRELANRFIKVHWVIIRDHQALIEGNRAKVINGNLMTRFKSEKRGVVVAAFHLGPYRYVPHELSHLGFNIKCPVRESVAKQQGAIFRQLAEIAHERTEGKFEMLIAENPRSIVQGLRELKQGALLLYYIDGNTGVGGAGGGQKHGADFQLLSMPVRMRTGVAYLAHKAQAPIVIAASYYNESGERCVEFIGPIEPPSDKSDEARIACTTEIYPHIEGLLKKYPEQWEGWMYPYRFWADLKRPPTVTREQLEKTLDQVRGHIEDKEANPLCKADPLKVGIMKESDNYYIFDGRGHRILGVNETASEIVKKAFDGIDLQNLVKSIKCDQNTLALEVSKLVLARLLSVEGIQVSD